MSWVPSRIDITLTKLSKKYQDNKFQFISTLNCKITSNIYIQIENREKPFKGRKYKGKKMNKKVQIEKITSNIYIQIENCEKPSKGRKYKGKKMNKKVQIEKVISFHTFVLQFYKLDN